MCAFCGLNAIRDKIGGFKYMSIDIASSIALEMIEFTPKARIEFAMRGEPLVHPQATDIFEIFRSACPKAQMMVTTNGDTLRNRMETRLELLFASGLNYVLMDTYYPKEQRDALRAEAYSLQGKFTVVDYFDDWMPIGMSPYHNHGTKIQRTVVLLDDLAARTGEHVSRYLKTHAGANPQSGGKILNLRRNCGRPFREMTIAYNGDVTLCCDDWRHEYVCGNVSEESLESIWAGKKMEAARARLFQKDRSWGLCKYCDCPAAPRTGLLPVYEPPTADQIQLTEMTYRRVVPLWEKHDQRSSSGHSAYYSIEEGCSIANPRDVSDQPPNNPVVRPSGD